MNSIRRIFRNRSGATTIEYALIASLISIAAASALANVGEAVDSSYTEVAGEL